MDTFRSDPVTAWIFALFAAGCILSCVFSFLSHCSATPFVEKLFKYASWASLVLGFPVIVSSGGMIAVVIVAFLLILLAPSIVFGILEWIGKLIIFIFRKIRSQKDIVGALCAVVLALFAVIGCIILIDSPPPSSSSSEAATAHFSTIPIIDFNEYPSPDELPFRSPEDFETPLTINWTGPEAKETEFSPAIVFISVPEAVSAGSYARVSIRGAPNTRYYITVTYSSGNSEASGLYPKYSDSEGYVTWGWIVGGNTYSGSHTITVSGGGETESANFTVK